jgi:flavin-dependent dehydrogenase
MVMGELSQETQVLVIGSGPGGYAAAYRAAGLVTLSNKRGVQRIKGRAVFESSDKVRLNATEELISEGVLAIEMETLVQDMALSIHPHPTLSETVGEVAEIFLGSVTHLLPKKDR